MPSQAARTLKTDSLGRIERASVPTAGGERPVIRRLADGGRIPGSAWVARRLLARERRALGVLEHSGSSAVVEAVPRLAEGAPFPVPARPRRELRRTWLEGTPLYAAEVLPEDFFERLEDLVRELHSCGLCHNDLHKEGNVLVAPDGAPRLIDFQLASVHPRFGRTFEVRAAEDLRHVAKHRRRYLRAGVRGGDEPPLPRRRSVLAAVWMRCGKPVYNFVTRRVLGTRDGEPRRTAGSPWPRWGPPLGPRQGSSPDPYSGSSG